MKIAVIGGGAAGLTAAISAARKNAHVTVFEKNDRVGKKILMTGNGKCNLSNTNLSPEFYYSGDRSFVLSALERFGLNETVQFFNSLGLLLTEKRGGIYPHSEQASAVLDALRFEAASLGVSFMLNCNVKEVEPSEKDKGFDVVYDLTDGEKRKKDQSMHFDKVIVTTGGKAAPKTGSDGAGYRIAGELGLKMTKLYPALCGVKCDGDFWKSISGVRAQASLLIECEESGEGFSYGELQITDYGISGIPVFQISRIIAEMLEKGKVTVDIDFFPDVDEGVIFNEFMTRVMFLSGRNYEQFLGGFINKKLALCVLKKLGIKPSETISDDKALIGKLVNALKHFRVTVNGVNSYDQSQTTAGGILLSEITGDFESKTYPGLYFAGEVLDADGVCGGYNLQWAWTGGFIAGEAASTC